MTTTPPTPKIAGGLLPCPFCGAEPKLAKCVGYDQGQSSISCANCDVYMMDIHSHVIETWNRRELCRAAPAGGDYSGCCDTPAYCSSVRRCTAKDSAPAGSGEVEDTLRKLLSERNHRTDGTLQELADRCLHLSRGDRDLIAMLRKLQQGADYVIVPREPTDEMVWAGRDAWTAAHHAMKAGESRYPMTETWRAMISASQVQEGGHASVD